MNGPQKLDELQGGFMTKYETAVKRQFKVKQPNVGIRLHLCLDLARPSIRYVRVLFRLVLAACLTGDVLP